MIFLCLIVGFVVGAAISGYLTWIKNGGLLADIGVLQEEKRLLTKDLVETQLELQLEQHNNKDTTLMLVEAQATRARLYAERNQMEATLADAVMFLLTEGSEPERVYQAGLIMRNVPADVSRYLEGSLYEGEAETISNTMEYYEQ